MVQMGMPDNPGLVMLNEGNIRHNDTQKNITLGNKKTIQALAIKYKRLPGIIILMDITVHNHTTLKYKH